MTEITIVLPDGSEFTVPVECLSLSEYLDTAWSSRILEDPTATVLEIKGVTAPYLEFAIAFLRAVCGKDYDFREMLGKPLEEVLGDNNDLYALTDPDRVKEHPDLMIYVFGYLGILTFEDFYQLMLLEAIQAGQITRNMAMDVKEPLLKLLTDEQLFAISEFNPRMVDKALNIPNARRYLQVRVSHWRIALFDGIQFEIKSRRRLYIRGRPVNTDNRIMKVYAHRADKDTGYYYYIDDKGNLFEGVISGDVVEGTNPLDLPEYVTDCSTNGKTTLILTAGGNVYGYGDNTHQQVGDGDPIIPDPIQLPLDFYCVQAVVGEERSILLSREGRVYSFNNGSLRVHDEIPIGVRQVVEDPVTQDLQVLTADLKVVLYDNGVPRLIASNIYMMVPNNLFINSVLNLVAVYGVLVEKKVVAVAASESYELYLTTTDATRVVKYYKQGDVIRREKVLRAVR